VGQTDRRQTRRPFHKALTLTLREPNKQQFQTYEYRIILDVDVVLADIIFLVEIRKKREMFGRTLFDAHLSVAHQRKVDCNSSLDFAVNHFLYSSFIHQYWYRT